MRRMIVLAVACTALAFGPASAQGVKTGKDTGGKPFLQTPGNMTLYVFDGDGKPGSGSTCVDQCANAWPAFGADQNAAGNGDWSVISRKDGSRQWAYKGRPLYTFAKDTAPGQENGNSYNGNKWHVAEP